MAKIFKMEADIKSGVRFDVRKPPKDPSDISHIKMVEKPCAACGTPRKVSANVKFPYCHKLCALKGLGPKVFKRGVNVSTLVAEE